MRLAWAVMVDRWTHTAAINTTLRNINRAENAAPEDVLENHPLMLPEEYADIQVDDDAKVIPGAKMSLWDAYGEVPPIKQ